jgi:tetratricopeptide (TPR) repeat protein
MGFMSGMKANKAHRLQQQGKREEAIKLYEEAFSEGLNDARYLLAYALLIIREGQYQKAREFLVAHQKVQMAPGQRTELLVYYATCCFRLGNLDKGISVLEQQFRKGETGLLYQTLGYLYVEKYDMDHRPDFAAMAAEAAGAEEAPQADENAAEETSAEESTAEETPAAETDAAEEKAPKLSPEEEWNAGIDKAEKFIRESVEYDDEDPVCLDNLGEFLYRVRGDRAGAKEYFDKAIAIKDTQIDTLYFLSRYDLEAGDKKAALEKLEKAAGGRFSPLNYCNREKITKEIEELKGAL